MKSTQFVPLTSLIPFANLRKSLMHDRFHVAFYLPLIRCRYSSSSSVEEFSTALHCLCLVAACLDRVGNHWVGVLGSSELQQGVVLFELLSKWYPWKLSIWFWCWWEFRSYLWTFVGSDCRWFMSVWSSRRWLWVEDVRHFLDVH